MSDCNHNCSTCSSNCKERDLTEKLNELSRVGKVIAVVSGKGGVGKSMVTSMLAVEMRRRGKRVAILDADITGPSIPKAFGITEKADSDGKYIYPQESRTGIQVMSINLLLENDTDPVIWRGPVIAGAVKQFWTDVIWNDVDYMFVDMPPGTGDVPLTVFQSLPVDGIVVVTTPQELVSMIVGKAVNMAKTMNIPVLGLVENKSYFICPECKHKHSFGLTNIDSFAKDYNIKTVCQLPLNPELASVCDRGLIELNVQEGLDDLCAIIETL